nr:hypothetical protein [Tanacetum cinerariifolium]
MIWKSIQNGPTPHPQTTDPAPEGGAVPPPRNKRDKEFTEEDNRNELADIQAINILSQGLSRCIFNILNQNETGREIWVNLELLMKGSGQTLERRKEALFVTQLDIPIHQLNTKFSNNLPSYWGKYVTHAKNNMNMSTFMYVELFTHLRTYEEHALKSLKKKEQSAAVVDPLAYLAKTTPTHSTTSPKQFSPTNNKLQTSSNPKNHATVHDGQIVTKTVQRRASGNMGTKGIQTTGLGMNNSGKKLICYNCRKEGHVARQCKEPKPNHEDAYDSNVDEGPYASASFIANLSSTEGTNGSSSSHINEVQISDDSFFSNVSFLLAQEMQQEENLNSKVDLVLADNMITVESKRLILEKLKREQRMAKEEIDNDVDNTLEVVKNLKLKGIAKIDGVPKRSPDAQLLLDLKEGQTLSKRKRLIQELSRGPGEGSAVRKKT